MLRQLCLWAACKYNPMAKLRGGMDETFLPWWLVLLLGMWATALTIWQHPSVHREIRLWAGLLTLVYFGLIFLALGFLPRLIGSAPSSIANVRWIDLGQVICAAISLMSAAWMLGRISFHACRSCYILMTFSNAAFCALVGQSEIGLALSLVAVLAAREPVLEWLRRGNRSIRSGLAIFFRFTDEHLPVEKTGVIWLTGGISFLLACVLIGTLAYSHRVESTRAMQSSRVSVIPSREQLDRIHSMAKRSPNDHPLVDLAFGQRADVVVLLAAILFLSLAVALNESRTKTTSVANCGGPNATENSL